MNRRHTVLVVDDESDVVASVKDLLSQLQGKNTELEAANAELRRADELKGAFIRVASHELRTPLTILMGIGDLAMRQKDLPQPLAGYLKRMHAAGQRLQYLIDQIVGMLAAQQFERWRGL